MSLKAPRPALPGLNALRAFEAAARQESFVRAAEELNVTPGAVAQQVKALEAWLGQPLFHRLIQGLRLTEEARAVLPELVAAFDGLGQAVRSLRQAAGPTELRIAALPAIAQLWLSPRRSALAAAAGGAGISISALETLPNFGRELFDLAVFYSEGPVAGTEVIPLAEDRIFPVCSPALRDGAQPLRAPADLAGHTLLHDASWRDDWALWLGKAGVAGVDGRQGPSFSLYSLALEAAVEGAGVLMGHEALVAPALARGDLVAPFELTVATGRHFSLLLPKAAAEDARRDAIAAWFRAAAAADGP